MIIEELSPQKSPNSQGRSPKLRILLLVWVLLHALQPNHCLGQASLRSTKREAGSLRVFLQDYLKDPSADDKKTRLITVFVDLNNDNIPEAIVYLTDQTWCGSGGCTMLVLIPQNGSYKVLTRTTVTQLPIRVLNTKSKGWHDIAVQVAGGGIHPGHEAILSFDGKTYPSNPSAPPARESDYGKIPGRILIPSNAKGQLFFP